MLGCWLVGVLACWRIGLLAYWLVGVLAFRLLGIMGNGIVLGGDAMHRVCTIILK